MTSLLCQLRTIYLLLIALHVWFECTFLEELASTQVTLSTYSLHFKYLKIPSILKLSHKLSRAWKVRCFWCLWCFDSHRLRREHQLHHLHQGRHRRWVSLLLPLPLQGPLLQRVHHPGQQGHSMVCHHLQLPSGQTLGQLCQWVSSYKITLIAQTKI